MDKSISFNNACPAPSIGGIRELYVTDRKNTGRTWYYDETSTLQYGEVVGSSSDASWVRILTDLRSSEITQTLQRDPVRSYDIELNVRLRKTETQSRDAVERLAVIDTPVFIANDFYGQYCLVGEAEGCRIDSDTTIGAVGDASDITFIARCLQRSPIREVSATFVAEILARNALCPQLLDDLCSENLSTLCSQPLV